jgi:hydroxymethylpyrimidine pyrophosphatase-like HAD family hydrolase
MKQYILAVDFDGTIVKTEDDYVPRSLMPNVKTVLDWARDKGCYIIIWTCRSGKMLKQAIDFLDKQKIPYDAVNKNAPWISFQTSQKIYYDLLIDDHAMGY